MILNDPIGLDQTYFVLHIMNLHISMQKLTETSVKAL
jgi:hypothetical protein